MVSHKVINIWPYSYLAGVSDELSYNTALHWRKRKCEKCIGSSVQVDTFYLLRWLLGRWGLRRKRWRGCGRQWRRCWRRERFFIVRQRDAIGILRLCRLFAEIQDSSVIYCERKHSIRLIFFNTYSLEGANRIAGKLSFVISNLSFEIFEDEFFIFLDNLCWNLIKFTNFNG